MNEREYVMAIEEALLSICKKMNCEDLYPDLIKTVRKRYSTRGLVNKLNIEMILTNSSNIDSIGHNKEHNVLKIRFKNGGLYAYLDVPDTILTEAVKAKSAGKYFTANIRNKYECVKIN